MKVTIDVSPSTFEELVKCQIILEERHNRAISSDELIGLLLMKLSTKLNQHEKSNSTGKSENMGRWPHEGRSKRASRHLDTLPRIDEGLWLVSRN